MYSGDDDWFQQGLQGVGTLDEGLLDITMKLSEQVDVFVSEIARLNGQLVILENGLPLTAPEGRSKRQYCVQAEVLHNKIRQVSRALEVLKIALGDNYQANLAPQPPPSARPPDVAQAPAFGFGGQPQPQSQPIGSIAQGAYDPYRQEGPPQQGTNAALGGAFGCARYDPRSAY